MAGRSASCWLQANDHASDGRALGSHGLDDPLGCAAPIATEFHEAARRPWSAVDPASEAQAAAHLILADPGTIVCNRDDWTVEPVREDVGTPLRATLVAFWVGQRRSTKARVSLRARSCTAKRSRTTVLGMRDRTGGRRCIQPSMTRHARGANQVVWSICQASLRDGGTPAPGAAGRFRIARTRPSSTITARITPNYRPGPT